MKKSISLILIIAMLLLLVGCNKDEEIIDGEQGNKDSEKEMVKVGITVQSLENNYWKSVMDKLGEIMKDKGWEYEILDCGDNAGTQISQIEDFIDDKCDLIMVHPSDAASVEKICGEAVMDGIKVMCWDDPMENSTVNWVLDNTELGLEIGRCAAEFINKYYSAKVPAKVVTIGYPSTKVLMEREKGIIAGLEEACDEGNYEIVASIEGIEADVVEENCEMAFAYNPDVTVFVGVGAGAMIGANRALLEKFDGPGNIPESVGVITTDVTMEQLEALKAGDEAVRAIIGFEGSSQDTAQACFEMFERILYGEEFDIESKNIVRPIQRITEDNIDTIMEGM